MIKNKKIWLTLATISAVGFVPATVLACGSNKSEVKKSEVTANVASFKVVEGSNIVSDTKIHLKDFTSAKKPAKDQILKLIIGRKHENHLDDEKDASYTVKGIANEEIVFSFNGLKLAEEDNSTATEATYKIHSLWLNGEEVEIANKDTFEFKIYDKLENSLIAHIKKTISEIEELTKTETNLKDQDKVTLEELKEIFSIYKLINSPDQIDAKITEFTSKISEEAKKTTKKNDLDKIKAQATKLKEAFETTDAAKLTHLITSVEAALTKIETKLKSAITNTQETQADQPAAENGEPSDMQKDAMMAKSSGAQGGKDKKNMSQNEQSDSSSDMMDASKAK
uniref:hypothetical protein n=1 Tax=[Mycoplasma] collis TaxID=2127 RepID=UPI00051C88D9